MLGDGGGCLIVSMFRGRSVPGPLPLDPGSCETCSWPRLRQCLGRGQSGTLGIARGSGSDAVLQPWVICWCGPFVGGMDFHGKIWLFAIFVASFLLAIRVKGLVDEFFLNDISNEP